MPHSFNKRIVSNRTKSVWKLFDLGSSLIIPMKITIMTYKIIVKQLQHSNPNLNRSAKQCLWVVFISRRIYKTAHGSLVFSYKEEIIRETGTRGNLSQSMSKSAGICCCTFPLFTLLISSHLISFPPISTRTSFLNNSSFGF